MKNKLIIVRRQFIIVRRQFIIVRRQFIVVIIAAVIAALSISIAYAQIVNCTFTITGDVVLPVCAVATNTATETAVPTITHTNTPTPTNTPTATYTRVPQATFTPIAQETREPFAGAPFCKIHSTTEYHSLWNSALGCHYDHFHGQNPNDGCAVDIFGRYPLSQTVSYSWMTHTVDMSIIENRDKHTGYIHLNRCDLPYHPELNWIGTAPMAITDLRFQGHFMTRVNNGLQDDITRIHSYFLEVKICTITGKVITADCGIIRGGGHWDTGILHIPYKEFHVPLNVDPPKPALGFNLNEDPYRAHLKTATRIFANLAALPDAFSVDAVFNFDDTNRDNPVLWTYAPGKYGFQRHGLGAMVMVLDHPNALNPNDPVNPIPIHSRFPSKGRQFNGSEWAIFTVGAKVPTWMDGTVNDSDGLKNGRITYHGFTNTFGSIDTNCKAAGEFCVPYDIENVPVVGNGWGAYDTLKDNGKERISEFDISPSGEWWVK